MLALVVDDNPVDVELLKMAFDQDPDWPVEIVTAAEGDSAISLLNEFAEGARGVMPDFIVLDLNLPRGDGAEVLNVLRNNQALAGIPVAMFSSSPGDVIRLKLTDSGVGAEGYFAKPLDLDKFLAMGKTLREWFQEQKGQTSA